MKLNKSAIQIQCLFRCHKAFQVIKSLKMQSKKLHEQRLRRIGGGVKTPNKRASRTHTMLILIDSIRHSV